MSYSIWLSLPLGSPSLWIPLSSRRTFSTSLACTYRIRKNVPRSFPLSAISFPCRFNPSHYPCPSFSLSRSLLLLHHFIILVLRTRRSFRFISRNNSVHPQLFVPVFVSLTHAASHTHVSTLLLIFLSHPFASDARASIQSATPIPSVYVPLMREGNLAYC